MDEVESASFDNGSERYMTILTRISPYTYPMTPIGDAGMRRDPPPDLTQKEQSIALLSLHFPSCLRVAHTFIIMIVMCVSRCTLQSI